MSQTIHVAGLDIPEELEGPDEIRWITEEVRPYIGQCERCGGECCNCGACRKTKGTGLLCFRCALVPFPRVPPKGRV